jgi:hypothetical protein
MVRSPVLEGSRGRLSITPLPYRRNLTMAGSALRGYTLSKISFAETASTVTTSPGLTLTFSLISLGLVTW